LEQKRSGPLNLRAGGRGLRPHYVLILVSALYSFAALDRSILSLLVDPICRDLGLSDGEFGLLIGLGFAGTQFLFALPVARWIDTGDRRLIIVISVTIWSGATILSGFVTSATQLLLCRMGVGMGESSNSVYHSVISDVYRKERRPRAVAFYYAMSAAVSIVGFAIGGWLAQKYGWRWTLIAAGLPGLLLALLVRLTMSDPARGGAEVRQVDAGIISVRKTLTFIAEQKTYLLMVAGNVVLGLGWGTVLFWYPAFLARVHGLGGVEIGLFVGLGTGLAAFFGYFLGGYAVERLSQIDERWRSGYPALALVIMAPLIAAGAWVPNAYLAIAAFTLATLFQASILSGIIALTQSVLAPRMRGLGAAIFNMCSGLSALGLAPLWSGILNDKLTPVFGDQAVRYSFFSAVVAGLGAACLFWLARKPLIGDLQRIDRL
jgi:MFS family permease